MTTLAAAANTPIITAGDRFGLTLFFAMALHGIIILGVGFNVDKADLDAPNSLEIILVQNHATDAPDKADYLAQIAQQGGDISEHRDRPGSPFVATEMSQQDGVAPIPMHRTPSKASEPDTNPLITQLYADHAIQQHKQQDKPTEATPETVSPSEFDLEIARLTTELNIAKEAYAKRPRKMVLTASTHAYLPAQYMSRWISQVERIGNLNLPDETRRRNMEGALLLEVELNSDGQVVDIKLLQSSGHQILDDTARRIVEIASPFAPFPADLRKITDHLQIVRTWIFTKNTFTSK